jgi:hypothetical protein
MSGSGKLTEEERREMLEDARDPGRRAAFSAAMRLSHEGGLDDYINFLSENMNLVGPWRPRVHVTLDYRL